MMRTGYVRQLASESLRGRFPNAISWEGIIKSGDVFWVNRMGCQVLSSDSKEKLIKRRTGRIRFS